MDAKEYSKDVKSALDLARQFKESELEVIETALKLFHETNLKELLQRAKKGDELDIGSKLINETVLFTAMEDYIKLLEDELDEVVPLAAVHGWKTKRFEEGEKLRGVIEEMKEKLYTK